MPIAGNDNAGWNVPYTIAGVGEKTITFKTENRFVDADARVTITTPAATEPTLAITDITTGLSMGTAASGKYSPTVNLSGNANIGTAGWIAAGNHTVSDTSVKVGTVNQSTLKNGTTTIDSGSTITPTGSAQTITISEGYNAARTIIVGAADSSSPGEITSGSATITGVNYLYNSTNDNFIASGSGDVSAPTVDAAGYISSTKGTKNSNAGGATLNATVDKIVLDSVLTGATSARKPTINKQSISITGVTDAASGNATATAPSSGVYVAVRGAANTATITSGPVVRTAGYGDSINFGVGTAATATVGAAQSDIYYVPITTTSATVSGRNVTYGTGWITGGTSSVGVGTITSAAGTAIISSPTWDSTNSKFTQTASGAIAAPHVNTAGYISSTEGTKNGNSIFGSKDLDTVKVGVEVDGTARVTPEITRTEKPSADTWVDAASGAATTTKPTSGAYIQVNAAAKNSRLTIIGKVSEEGYGTTDHYLTDASTRIPAGSNAAEDTYVPIKVASIISGDVIIDSVTVGYDSTSSSFAVGGSTRTNIPTIEAEGYVSNDIGSRSTGYASINATLPKIGIKANLSGTGTKAPSITKNSATNITAAGTATTTKPSSGYYVAVSSAANTTTVKATATVVSEGYGTTTAGEYTATDSSNLTVGAAASSVTYVPITSTTFANSGTSGVTYSDISSSAPVLVSGDYLYINAGYTPNVKISLAQLVPDATGDNAPANYILAGYTAFDNNGDLIVGTMQTYDGTYTIT